MNVRQVRGHPITSATDTNLENVLGSVLDPPAIAVIGIIVLTGNARLYYDFGAEENMAFHDQAATGRPNNIYFPWKLALRAGPADGTNAPLRIQTTGTVSVIVLYEAGS